MLARAADAIPVGVRALAFRDGREIVPIARPVVHLRPYALEPIWSGAT